MIEKKENKKVGFTIGKFAPLHKGHQYLIETALKEMDKMIVVVYDTDLIDIFPDHAVIESNCTDFAVCDSYTIDAMKNVVKGSFVSYTTYENILVISGSSDEEFEPFGSKKVLTKLPKQTPQNNSNSNNSNNSSVNNTFVQTINKLI